MFPVVGVEGTAAASGVVVFVGLIHLSLSLPCLSPFFYFSPFSLMCIVKM